MAQIEAATERFIRDAKALIELSESDPASTQKEIATLCARLAEASVREGDARAKVVQLNVQVRMWSQDWTQPAEVPSCTRAHISALLLDR